VGEQPEHVERRFVRPVQVLEHEHGRRHDFGKLAGGDLGDVEQRPERTRSEQRLAGAASPEL
jgi:hypothetical protein